ncbi:hypothetical protein NPIL_137741 [Nephila pilipes]|uniref:Uncharacterized protein n=1 Tax=Nephila pilipes TaxID=299642 RepID=A0A8X6N2Y2_NEPPI|nr:hypothetical protein NPIL_137741 [Nephila pilipes]
MWNNFAECKWMLEEYGGSLFCPFPDAIYSLCSYCGKSIETVVLQHTETIFKRWLKDGIKIQTREFSEVSQSTFVVVIFTVNGLRCPPITQGERGEKNSERDGGIFTEVGCSFKYKVESVHRKEYPSLGRKGPSSTQAGMDEKTSE